MRKILTSLALAGVLLGLTECKFPERVEQRGIVDSIDFVKNSKSGNRFSR